MKGVLIVFAPALENEVMAALRRAKAPHYTKFPYLHGEGGHSEPHLDTQVWPGANMGLFIAAEEKVKDAIVREIAALKKAHDKEGLKAFVFPLEEVV
jgi:nitrogen regulatory protein PII